MLLAGVLFLQPMWTPGSFALARKRPPRAFSFFMEGGKASQEECDGERKIPRRMKHLKEYAKAGAYLGSEVQTFEIKSKDEAEMWKHFFNSKSACNTVLAKTPSSANKLLKDAKQELPPDEAAESDDDDKADESQEGPSEGPQKESATADPAVPPAAASGK